MSKNIEQENETIGTNFAESVVASAKTTRRFYEVAIFLLALNESYRGTASKKSNDLPRGTGEDSDEDLFHNFVCRLGQICDSRPGGATVTAFVVIQHPDKVEYVFGSNGMKEVELETTRGFIQAILTSLRHSSPYEDENLREEYLNNLFQDILIFNRERIRRYLNGLTAALEACIAICGAENSSTAMSRQKSLVHMRGLILLANHSDNDDDEFLYHTEELINALQSMQKQTIGLFLRKRASDDKSGNTGPWRNLQHHSSRLLAYRRAVETLWHSGYMWPSLLTNFEVTFIPSSIKASNPLNTSPQTASELLNRVIPTSVEAKGKYLDLVETMQRNFDLNKVIENEWTSKSFHPIVHAEILVHNWLEKTGGTRPERFFNNWRYIGCSKPACKLCDCYFSSHPSGVQIRGTHNNLYRNWRMPDYADVYGLRTKDEALAKRHEILQSITGHLRNCVLRTLEEKSTDSRPFDSNTISSIAVNYGPIRVGAQDPHLVASRSRLNSLAGAEAHHLVLNEDWETMVADGETGDGAGLSLETDASNPTD